MNVISRSMTRLGCAVAVALIGLTMTTAPASAEGSKYADSHENGVTYLAITGPRDNYVERVNVQHVHDFPPGNPFATYCGERAKFWGTLVNGQAYQRTHTRPQSECVRFSINIWWDVFKYFKHLSYITGQAGENGAYASGLPKLQIIDR